MRSRFRNVPIMKFIRLYNVMLTFLKILSDQRVLCAWIFSLSKKWHLRRIKHSNSQLLSSSLRDEVQMVCRVIITLHHVRIVYMINPLPGIKKIKKKKKTERKQETCAQSFFLQVSQRSEKKLA